MENGIIRLLMIYTSKVMKNYDFASRHDQIQDGCQIDPHGTLFRHSNIYNFLLDNICFQHVQKKLVSLNITGGAREAPIRLDYLLCCNNYESYFPEIHFCKISSPSISFSKSLSLIRSSS